MAQRAVGGSSGLTCYYYHRFGHVKVHYYHWLNTAKRKAYARKNPNIWRSIKSNNEGNSDEDAKFEGSRQVWPGGSRQTSNWAPWRDLKPLSTQNKRSGGKIWAKAANKTSDDENKPEISSSHSKKEDQDWFASEAATTDDKKHEKSVSMALELTNSHQASSEWMLDFSCSWHMTSNVAIFISMILYQKVIWIANGQQIYSEDLGTVNINVDKKLIKMSDVLYVPDFKSSLISISALNVKGLNVLYCQSGTVEIFRKNTCITTRILRGQTYYLESS